MKPERLARWSVAAAAVFCASGCGEDNGLGGPDRTPPNVVVIAPAVANMTRGVVVLLAMTYDNIAVTHVQFFVDGAMRKDAHGFGGYSYDWECNGLPPNSRHEIYAKAFDAAGNAGYSDTVIVTIPEQVVNCDPVPVVDADDRGFYLTEVPPGLLAEVRLYLSSDQAGSHNVKLTVRADTYDGPLIGESVRSAMLGGGSKNTSPASFVFDLPEIQSDSVVAFLLEFISGPPGVWRVYHAGTSCGSSCPSPCPVVETDGTQPPLDTVRSNGVALDLYIVRPRMQGVEGTIR